MSKDVGRCPSSGGHRRPARPPAVRSRSRPGGHASVYVRRQSSHVFAGRRMVSGTCPSCDPRTGRCTRCDHAGTPWVGKAGDRNHDDLARRDGVFVITGSLDTSSSSPTQDAQRLVATAMGRRRSGPSMRRRRHESSYTRPSAHEQIQIWQLHRQGLTARAIARRLKRDHHTVLRALDQERAANLAVALVVGGQAAQGLGLAQLMDDPELEADLVEINVSLKTAAMRKQLADDEAGARLLDPRNRAKRSRSRTHACEMLDLPSGR